MRSSSEALSSVLIPFCCLAFSRTLRRMCANSSSRFVQLIKHAGVSCFRLQPPQRQHKKPERREMGSVMERHLIIQSHTPTLPRR